VKFLIGAIISATILFGHTSVGINNFDLNLASSLSFFPWFSFIHYYLLVDWMGYFTLFA